MNNPNDFSQLTYCPPFGTHQQIYMSPNPQNFTNQLHFQNYNSNFQIQFNTQPNFPTKFTTHSLPSHVTQYQHFPNFPIDSRTEPNLFSTPFIQPPQMEPDRIKKNRRDRTTYTKFQKDTLERHFNLNAYPDVAVREKVSKELGITELNIQVWFKNRRAKRKRESAKSERDQLTPNTEGSMVNVSDRSNLNSSDEGKEIIGNSKALETISSVMNVKQEGGNLYMPHIGSAQNYNPMTTENYEILSRLNFSQNQYYPFNLAENSYLQQLNSYRSETI